MAKARKWYLRRLSLPALILGVVGIALAWNVLAGSDDGTRVSCGATRVHYERNALAGYGLRDLPWVSAGGGRNVIVGYLFYYADVRTDPRFNRSPQLVMPTNGRTPRGSTKILWVSQGDWGRTLLISGRRLDGSGSFDHREPGTGPGFPSIIEIPSPGCWRLTLAGAKLSAAFVVEAVEL